MFISIELCVVSITCTFVYILVLRSLYCYSLSFSYVKKLTVLFHLLIFTSATILNTKFLIVHLVYREAGCVDCLK
jgi:hypothetical protein